MERIRVGFAMCGSFCTFSRAVEALRDLAQQGYDITPIMSETAYSTDTRFGQAASFVNEIEGICAKPVIHSIKAAEPIGPKQLLDVLVIAPCTGNTLGKLALGITDTAVTMAAKSHLRNGRPVVIALSTNDALSGSAPGIAELLNRKNYYFVPFGQDDPEGKPTSLQADFTKIAETVDAALEGRQIQPILR